MRHRRTFQAAAALALGLLVTACDPGHTVGEMADPEGGVPDETPIIEPVSPPANETDLPDEEPGTEGGVPEGDDLGTEDGEETGAGDEPDESEGREDEDI